MCIRDSPLSMPSVPATLLSNDESIQDKSSTTSKFQHVFDDNNIRFEDDDTLDSHASINQERAAACLKAFVR
eukprot:7091780-Prymnesium_polylepis.1